MSCRVYAYGVVTGDVNEEEYTKERVWLMDRGREESPERETTVPENGDQVWRVAVHRSILHHVSRQMTRRNTGAAVYARQQTTTGVHRKMEIVE